MGATLPVCSEHSSGQDEVRRILALWLFSTRAYQNQWRFEQELADYTTRLYHARTKHSDKWLAIGNHVDHNWEYRVVARWTYS